MAMYDIAKNVIQSGNYKLTAMLDKLTTLWMEGQIDKEQRDELTQMAKQSPDARAELDVLAKLEDLDRRVAALEAGGGDEEAEEYPEYVDGKWYYNGDKASYNGKRYTCTAPSGVVCVWSPDEHPAYWEEVM